MSTRVLVVDDDPGLRYTLREILEQEGLEVAEAGDGEAGLKAYDAAPAPLVITDLRMPKLDGLGLLAALSGRSPAPRVILITANGSERDAVAAMKAGATDYFKKPFDTDELLAVVRRAVEAVHLRDENERLAGFQNALEAGEHHRPSDRHAWQGLAALREAFMGDDQLHHAVPLFDHIGNARGLLFLHVLVEDRNPAVGQPARRIRFQNHALVLDLAAALHGHARTGLPVGGERAVHPVAAGEVPVGQGMPELLRRGLDVGGVDEFRLTHHASPVSVSTR